MIDPDELYELVGQARPRGGRKDCQCDCDDFGRCPGALNCPNVTGYDDDDNDNE